MEHDYASGSGRCLRCGSAKNELHASPECYGIMRPGMPQIFDYAGIAARLHKDEGYTAPAYEPCDRTGDAEDGIIVRGVPS